MRLCKSIRTRHRTNVAAADGSARQGRVDDALFNEGRVDRSRVDRCNAREAQKLRSWAMAGQPWQGSGILANICTGFAMQARQTWWRNETDT